MRKEPLEVIGVVVDVRSRLGDRAIPIVYLPYRQHPAGTILLVRTAGNPTSYAPEVLDQVWSVDRDQPVRWIASLTQSDVESLRQRELSIVVVGLLAMVAVTLSVLGVYGVMSRYVRIRVREIGIRLALVATSRDLRWMVLRGTGLIKVSGMAAGICVSILLSSIVRCYLHGAQPADIRLPSATTILLPVASLAASYPSVRRSVSTDPGVSLRWE